MDWNSIHEKLNTFNNHITQCNYHEAVTTSMPRTFLMGNGDIAAISSGDSISKEYLVAKGDFWSCGDLKTDDVMGFNPRRVTLITVGKIKIENLSSSNSFHEQLDISCSSLTTKYDDTVIEAFCDANSNAIIIKMKSGSKKTVTVSFSAKGDVAEYPANVINDNGQYFVTRSSANFATDNPMSWKSQVAMSAKAINDTQMVFLQCDNNCVSYCVSLVPNKEAVICIAVSGGGKTYDNGGKLLKKLPINEASETLDNISDASKIMKEHKKWWEKYWCISSISISDFEMEKYYYGSLYLMACCSRDDKAAPGIFGNFITTDNPKWNSDFHMNYNYIAPFYGMYAANRANFARPLKDPIIDFIPEGKKRAMNDIEMISPKYIMGKKIGGIKHNERHDIKNGIDDAVLYPVALGPYGVFTWSEKGGYLTQMNDCAFTCMGITAYYFYTLEREYFCQIEELLMLNVNFFLKWREKEELGNGKYRYNIWSGAHEDTLELNSPHVLASIKNILKCLLDGYGRGYSDKNANLLDVWKDFLENLSPYPIRHFKYKKRFKTLFDDDVIPLGEKGLNVVKGHATVSLEFIQPGEELDFTSDEKLKSASRNLITVHKMMNPDIFRQMNNLPKIFIHAIRAEYDPLAIVKEFKNLYEHDFMYNYSVKDLNNTHGIEKAGGIEFINSMLLASDIKTIKVFPNWIKNKDAEFNNMLARGAFLVSGKYSCKNRTVDFIKVTSLVQEEINLVSPWSEWNIFDEQGKSVEHTVKSESYGKNILCFAAKTNHEYTFLPKK